MPDEQLIAGRDHRLARFAERPRALDEDRRVAAEAREGPGGFDIPEPRAGGGVIPAHRHPDAPGVARELAAVQAVGVS